MVWDGGGDGLWGDGAIGVIGGEGKIGVIEATRQNLFTASAAITVP